MFEIDSKDVKRAENRLVAVKSRALPFATRSTLNTIAFTGMKTARQNISEDMILRNKFTAQSIQVDQAKTLRITQQRATLGSTADYMETQEFGGVKTKSGKEGVTRTTPYASGEGMNAPVRLRLAKRPNAMRNIRLKGSGGTAKSRKQRNAIAVREAAGSGNRYIFLDTGKRKGIFKVVGGRKGKLRGKVKGAKLRMVQDMTQDSVVIPRSPWLAPVTDQVRPLVQDIYDKALAFQLARVK